MTRRAGLHPILFGLYAILFAYAQNVDFAPPIPTVVVWLAAFGLGAAALSMAFGLALGDRSKGAVAASVFILMCFSYGHLKTLLASPLEDAHLLSVDIGPRKVLFVAWGIGWLALARWFARATPGAVEAATRAFNRAGMALMLLSAIALGTVVDASGHGAASSRRPREAGASGAPDIYYIILDDYARADVLKNVFGYDNSPFIEWLRRAGFYVADESRSNYVQTMLSLASSLNASYLRPDELAMADSRSASRWHVALNLATARYLNASLRPLVHMIQYSRTVSTLRSHGYQFVAVTSGFGGVQLPNADVVLRSNALSDFEEAVVGATPLSEIDRFYDPLELHRRHVAYALDHLADAAGSDGPRFVFAHILCPHPPFVFAADGAEVRPSPGDRRLLFADHAGGAHGEEREKVARAYRDQVQFVNTRIERAIGAILARSVTRPIIVLQSDHGSDLLMDWANPSAASLDERTAILNAFYVPPDIRAKLYPRITPVNTFRILLGRYFSGEDEPLPDESYFSTYQEPFAFAKVAQR